MFSFVVPGDPPSVNHMYRITQRKLEGGKVRAFMAKTRDAEHFQTGVALLTRSARPTAFQPKGYIWVIYEFKMGRGKDTDNLLKAFNDAIAVGLGIDDRWFLSVVKSKTTGNKQPETKVTVLDSDAYDISVIAR